MRTLILFCLALTACTDSADVDLGDTDTDEPTESTADGTVTISAADAGAETPVDVISGIAFANLDDGGRLYVALASWEPTCDTTGWASEADAQGYPWAYVMVPPANDAGDDLIVTWSTGAADGSGTIFDFDVTLSDDDASSLVEGDAVTGTVSPEAGELDDLTATTLTFDVVFCGDQSEI